MNIARWLSLALLSLPILDLYLLIKLIGALGFVFTLALLLLAAAAGMSLLRTQGLSTWIRVQEALAHGESPARELVESGLVAVGGLLLLIPGFLSDLLALFCLIPASRQRLVLYFLANAPWVSAGGMETHPPSVIDGEFRREEGPRTPSGMPDADEKEWLE